MSFQEYRDALRSSEAIEKAENLDLACIAPGDNQLFIDLDSDEEYKEYKKTRAYFDGLVGHSYKELIYRSRRKEGGRHVVITLTHPITTWQRLAMQFALGSDSKREFLSVVRAMLNDPYPTLFLETKAQAIEVHGVNDIKSKPN